MLNLEGKTRYRLGAHLSVTPPTWNSVHKKAGSYPHRFELPKDVHPGKTAPMKMTLPAFTKPGVWTLQVDMVREGHTWFEHAEMAGDIPLQVTLRVTLPGTKDGGLPPKDGPQTGDGPGPKDGPGPHDADGEAVKDLPALLPDGWEAGSPMVEAGPGTGEPQGDGCECGLAGGGGPLAGGLLPILLVAMLRLARRRAGSAQDRSPIH